MRIQPGGRRPEIQTADSGVLVQGSCFTIWVRSPKNERLLLIEE